MGLKEVKIKGFRVGHRWGEFFIIWEVEGELEEQHPRVEIILAPSVAKQFALDLRRQLRETRGILPSNTKEKPRERKLGKSFPQKVIRALYRSKALTRHLRLINTHKKKKLSEE